MSGYFSHCAGSAVAAAEVEDAIIERVVDAFDVLASAFEQVINAFAFLGGRGLGLRYLRRESEEKQGD